MSRPNPRNLVIGWPNAAANAASITGPGWVGLANLGTDNLGQSASLVDLSAGRPITISWTAVQVIDCVAAIGHNLSAGAKIQVDLYLSGAAVYTTGQVDVWPAWPWGSIPFPDPRWWGHRPVLADLTGIAPIWSHLLPDPVIADTAVITISDPANSLGFLDLPVLWAGSAWQVSVNYNFGSTTGWHAAGDVDGGDDGVPSGAAAGQPRQFTCQLSWLDHDEAMARIDSLVAYAGIGRRPFLLLPDPGDTWQLARRSLWAWLPAPPDLVSTETGGQAVQLTFRQWRA